MLLFECEVLRKYANRVTEWPDSRARRAEARM